MKSFIKKIFNWCKQSIFVKTINWCQQGILAKAINWCKQTVSKQKARTLYIIAGGVVLAVILLVTIILLVTRGDADKEPVAVVPEYNVIREEVLPTVEATPEPEPDENNYEEEPEYKPEADPTTHTGPTGMLTGLPIDEEYLYRRPMAVVVNNIIAALPQTGLSYADVVYEVLAEGNITRLIAIFQSRMPEVVGPVRSTRNYFAPMAMNHDAFFVHHGGSDAGYARIRELGIENLDGMRLAAVFWRDRSFPAWAGRTGQRSVEHSSYTGWPQIYAHLTARNIRDNVREGDEFGFDFGAIPDGVTPLGDAVRISVPFSRDYTRIFYFLPDYNRYAVYNPRGAQVDVLTEGNQITTSNILVQITNMRVIDNVGRRNVTLVGEGRGYLFTNGRQYAVQWKKGSLSDPMRWYFECGTPLVLQPGSTWICVLQNTAMVDIA